MQIKMGENPYEEAQKTGNWSSLTCDDPAALVKNWGVYTAKLRWGMLDADHAWANAVTTYNLRKVNEPDLGFSEALGQIFGHNVAIKCQQLGAGDGYSGPIGCIKYGTGAAGYLILVSTREYKPPRLINFLHLERNCSFIVARRTRAN